jgi:hypothetical protein
VSASDEEAPVPPEAISNLLLPNGQPVGNRGSHDAIRELTEGPEAAEALFERLSDGGMDVTPLGHRGKLVQIPGGGHIGYRPTSRSGPPTIDVNIPGIAIRKLKFRGS